MVMKHTDEPRWLMWHPESESLFEMRNERQVRQAELDGCSDVTGIEKWEVMFKKYGKFVPEETIMSDEPLHQKYRPRKLKDVLGHKEQMKSLVQALATPTRPHSFLFSGPSGVGKTTVARILAAEFDCEPANVIEVDAATNTGIDDMRKITDVLKYAGFGETPNKLFIIDECHALSKQAWQSLLKSVEEPPEHVYFAFCTTDPAKVPQTIVTRCLTYNFKPVKFDDIMDLLETVADKEDLKVSNEVLGLIGRAANGSPRQALVHLAALGSCDDPREARIVLEQPLEDKEVIDLCRALVSGKLSWKETQEILKGCSDTPPESIRIIIVNYLNSCLMGCSEKDVPRLLDILSQFSKPINPSDKMGPILLAIGNLLYP
jgi:DNA polymerase-3 subunit gamma/tau